MTSWWIKIWFEQKYSLGGFDTKDFEFIYREIPSGNPVPNNGTFFQNANGLGDSEVSVQQFYLPPIEIGKTGICGKILIKTVSKMQVEEE